MIAVSSPRTTSRASVSPGSGSPSWDGTIRVGIPLAAILLGMLFRGQDGVSVTTDLPTEVLIILQGLLILSVVIAYALAQRFINSRSKKRIAAETEEEVRT